MYRLLLVDDEPDIVEGLYNAFYNYEGLELDIFKAYSSYEALDILNSERIDIVLSDISMPGMNGLEMMRQVKSRWPHCQVIFLSGYTEFDYIYQANQLEAVSYILKTEGYDVVKENLHKAVQRIKDQASLKRLEGKQLEFRHEFLVSLLETPDIGQEGLVYMIRNMNIDLNPHREIYLMAGLITNSQSLSIKEQSLVYPFLEQLTSAYIRPHYDLILDEYKKDLFVFLLQLQEQDGCKETDPNNRPNPVGEIKGIAEMMQNSFSAELAIDLSFIIWGEPISFSRLKSAYVACFRLLHNSKARGAGLVITKPGILMAAEGDEILSEVTPAEFQAVNIIREHISNNLDKPLSLTALADLVHYNTSYLSRAFKRYTGMTLTRYITTMRMQKAQELLVNTNYKISSIAEQLCFASPSYFNQTFRKCIGMSPMEYRNSYSNYKEHK